MISEEEYDPLDGEVDGDEHRVNKDNEVLVKPAVKHIKKKSRFAKGAFIACLFFCLILFHFSFESTLSNCVISFGYPIEQRNNISI